MIAGMRPSQEKTSCDHWLFPYLFFSCKSFLCAGEPRFQYTTLIYLSLMVNRGKLPLKPNTFFFNLTHTQKEGAYFYEPIVLLQETFLPSHGMSHCRPLRGRQLHFLVCINVLSYQGNDLPCSLKSPQAVKQRRSILKS